MIKNQRLASLSTTVVAAPHAVAEPRKTTTVGTAKIGRVMQGSGTPRRVVATSPRYAARGSVSKLVSCAFGMKPPEASRPISPRKILPDVLNARGNFADSANQPTRLRRSRGPERIVSTKNAHSVQGHVLGLGLVSRRRSWAGAGGEIIRAAREERFSGEKHHRAFNARRSMIASAKYFCSHRTLRGRYWDNPLQSFDQSCSIRGDNRCSRSTATSQPPSGTSAASQSYLTMDETVWKGRLGGLDGFHHRCRGTLPAPSFDRHATSRPPGANRRDPHVPGGHRVRHLT